MAYVVPQLRDENFRVTSPNCVLNFVGLRHSKLSPFRKGVNTGRCIFQRVFQQLFSEILHMPPVPHCSMDKREEFKYYCHGKHRYLVAIALKLAVFIRNMVVKNTPYVNPKGYLFLDQKRKLGMIKPFRNKLINLE